MENMKNIREKLFIGKHQKMERFSALFLILLFVLVFMATIGFRQNSVKNNNLISEKAMFNTDFKTSKTGTDGVVTGVYTNKEHTKSLVMLKFSDINKISTDAENYNLYLTAADVAGNQQRIPNEPSGGIYVFGDTGYVGLYLVNNAGFDRQVLQLTVRANLELSLVDDVGDEEGEGAETDGDASFDKFDQFNVYCNPGGKEAEVITALETDGTPDAAEIYRDTVSDSEVKLAQKENKKVLKQIEVSLNNVNEHAKRVDKLGVAVPDLPRVVMGDSIEHTGDDKEDLKDVVYDYKTQDNFKGALDFEWQGKSIQDGFLKEAMRNYDGLSSLTGKEFLVAQALDAKENPSSMKLRVEDWKMKDGRLIEDLNTGVAANDDYTAINKACQDYVKVLDEYYDLKRRYQTEDLVKFVRSEVTLDTISDLYTYHSGEGVVKVY